MCTTNSVEDDGSEEGGGGTRQGGGCHCLSFTQPYTHLYVYMPTHIHLSSIHQDTQNLFQYSLVAETHELPVPSTQSLPHSSGQPLTKGGRFHCPLVVHGVIYDGELGRGQILAFVSFPRI